LGELSRGGTKAGQGGQKPEQVFGALRREERERLGDAGKPERGEVGWLEPYQEGSIEKGGIGLKSRKRA